MSGASSVLLLVRPLARPSELAARVREELRPRLAAEVRSAWVTGPSAPRLSVVPVARTPLATFELDAPEGWRAPLVPGLRIDAYRVSSSSPRRGRGEVALLTTFRRRRGLDDESFLRRWHGGHSPLALEVHPMVGYDRHVVTRGVGPAPALDAIVYEHLARASDLFLPWRYFGGAARALPNMWRVARDVAGFIDLRSIESHLLVPLER